MAPGVRKERAREWEWEEEEKEKKSEGRRKGREIEKEKWNLKKIYSVDRLYELLIGSVLKSVTVKQIKRY